MGAAKDLGLATVGIFGLWFGRKGLSVGVRGLLRDGDRENPGKGFAGNSGSEHLCSCC